MHGGQSLPLTTSPRYTGTVTYFLGSLSLALWPVLVFAGVRLLVKSIRGR